MIFRFVFLGLLFAGPAFAANTKPISNPEMSAIFEADQADRSTYPINWKVVGVADEKRRARTECGFRIDPARHSEEFPAGVPI